MDLNTILEDHKAIQMARTLISHRETELSRPLSDAERYTFLIMDSDFRIDLVRTAVSVLRKATSY